MKNKKVLALIIGMVLLAPVFVSAANLPAGNGTIYDYLNNYGNGYVEIYNQDFSGLWNYTAIGSESANINIVDESGSTTFTTNNTSNFGIYDSVDFSGNNLLFKDASDNLPEKFLDLFGDTIDDASYFKLFLLTASSNPLAYLGANSIVLPAGTLIVGWNDNYSGTAGDQDYDDIIVAMQPVPEPATMLLLGAGLLGLAGYSRRKFLK